MNDNPDKIVSIKTRRPLAETKAAEAATQEQLDKQAIEAHLEVIDKLREQVVAGKIHGLVVAARHTEAGMFMNDVVFGIGGCPPEQAFAWVGLMEALKLEFADIALMSPILKCDGTRVDPDEYEIEVD